MGFFHLNQQKNEQKEEFLTKEELKNDGKLAKKLNLFTQAIERTYPPIRVMVWRSFLQGMFFSFGTTIGLSLLLAAVTFLLAQFQSIPGVEYFLRSTTLHDLVPQPLPSPTPTQ